MHSYFRPLVFNRVPCLKSDHLALGIPCASLPPGEPVVLRSLHVAVCAAVFFHQLNRISGAALHVSYIISLTQNLLCSLWSVGLLTAPSYRSNSNPFQSTLLGAPSGLVLPPFHLVMQANKHLDLFSITSQSFKKHIQRSQSPKWQMSSSFQSWQLSCSGSGVLQHASLTSWPTHLLTRNLQLRVYHWW